MFLGPHRVTSYSYPPGSHLAGSLDLMPESRARLLYNPFSCFLPLSVDFTLKIYFLKVSLGCPALWYLLKLGRVPWVAVIIKVVRLLNPGS